MSTQTLIDRLNAHTELVEAYAKFCTALRSSGLTEQSISNAIEYHGYMVELELSKDIVHRAQPSEQTEEELPEVDSDSEYDSSVDSDADTEDRGCGSGDRGCGSGDRGCGSGDRGCGSPEIGKAISDMYKGDMEFQVHLASHPKGILAEQINTDIGPCVLYKPNRIKPTSCAYGDVIHMLRKAYDIYSEYSEAKRTIEGFLWPLFPDTRTRNVVLRVIKQQESM
jgi:hypothetical protein